MNGSNLTGGTRRAGGTGGRLLGHLPPEVAVALTWQGPVQAPPRRPRRTAGGN